MSWSWATLTSVSNAAWLLYFVLSGFWMAVAAATSATVLAGLLAIAIARRSGIRKRPAIAISVWTAMLVLAFLLTGRGGLGTVLAASFVLQVIPSIWSAYRSANPSGISRGTWLLIFAELLSWGLYGLLKSDPRLITLGFSGVIASVLVLGRSFYSARRVQSGADELSAASAK